MYLGRDKILIVNPTDKVTPLGSPISEVVFMSQLDLTHEAIDEVRERIAKVVLEPDSPEKVAKLAELDKEEGEITQRQTTDSDKNRTMPVTKWTLDNCQTDAPDQDYYDKRKHLVVSELLKVMAERNVEEVEFGQILQNLADSWSENRKKAWGASFGKSIDQLNILDYHYAITGADRTNA